MRLRAGISNVSPGDADIAGLGGSPGQLLVYRRLVCHQVPKGFRSGPHLLASDSDQYQLHVQVTGQT